MGVVTRTADERVLRYEVWLVELDPTLGSEIRKKRPALIVSPDEMNRWLNTVIVVPMTTAQKSYPSRVPVSFGGKDGQVALDQIRAVDKMRLKTRLGRIEAQEAFDISARLVEMLAH
jgi:mRNA interferase MazF